MSSFSGYMLANMVEEAFTVRDLGQKKPEIAGGPLLEYIGKAYGLPRWHEFVLHSPVPLADEAEGEARKYRYRLLLIRGEGKIIILAPRRRIVDYALSQILNGRMSPKPRRISVYIDRVIEHCTQQSSEFLITSLHGRFSGSAKNVRSMSLYGDDVTNSPIYRENHPYFNFHSCGIGRRLFDGLPRLRPNEEGEIVRVSYDGFVNLNLGQRHHALELSRVMNFIFEHRWVDDWVSGTGKSK